jgi:hypothetical protein
MSGMPPKRVLEVTPPETPPAPRRPSRLKINFLLVPFLLLHLYVFLLAGGIVTYLTRDRLLALIVACIVNLALLLWQLA